MFPYTSKCELITLFKRDASNKRGKAADKSDSKVDIKECSSEKVGECNENVEMRNDEKASEEVQDVKDPSNDSRILKEDSCAVEGSKIKSNK